MSFDRYFDIDTGLLSTWSGDNYDGGDSCQKTGLYRFGRWFKIKHDKDLLVREKAKFEQECQMLESSERKNWYIRSPSQRSTWWSNPYCFSRDQHRSLVMAMGRYGQQKRLWKLLWEHTKRGFLYQNNRQIDNPTKWKMPDVTSPDHFAEILRALYMAGAKWLIILWPVLLFTDLCALIGLLASFPKWQNPDEADDDNMIMSYLQAKYALPTPISFLVRKIYKTTRPIAGFTDESKTQSIKSLYDHDQRVLLCLGPLTAMQWKHRKSTGAPPFATLYAEILENEL